MKKVNNWAMLATSFIVASFIWMATMNTPVYSIILGGIGLLCSACALIRYEEHVGFIK